MFDEKGEILPPKGLEADTHRAFFGKIGPSNHIVYAFLKRLGRTRDATGVPAGGADPGAHDVWQVVFAMDEFEFSLDDSKWGQVHVLKTIQIEFDTDKTSNRGPVVSVDGNAYTTSEGSWPEIVIPGGQLKRGTTNEIKLKINLDNLETVQTIATDGTTYTNKAGRATLYARHGTKDVGSHVFEMPQYGSAEYWILNDIKEQGKSCDSACQDEAKKEARFRELVGFNKDTGRIDTPFNISDQLRGAKELYDKRGDETALIAELKANGSKYIKPGWEKLKETMCRRFGINVKIPASVHDIQGEQEPSCSAGSVCSCPEPNFNDETKSVEFNDETQIVLVLDRSGSMGTEGGGDVKGEPVSRLDYVKNAGLDMMRQMSWNESYRRTLDADSTPGPDNPTAKGPKIGLVWFNDTPEVKFPIASDKACSSDTDCADDPMDPQDNASGVCQGGKCKNGMPRLECNHFPAYPQTYPTRDECSNLAGVTAQAVSETVLETQYMSLTNGAVTPIPNASGWTGTGAALKAAADLFDNDSSAKKKVVVLFTDGFHNRPEGGVCSDGKTEYNNSESCWPAANATAVYNEALEKFKDKDILLYTIPLGVSGEKSAMSIAEGQINGEVFQTQRPGGEDTIPAFAEVNAALTGQQLVRAADTLPMIRGGYYTNPTEYEIPVEVGARALHVTVSDYDATEENFADNIESAQLISPKGTVYSRHRSNPNDADDISPLSAHFHIPYPESGTWILSDVSSAGKYVDRHNRFYVTGLVDNPVPTCEASAGLQISDGTLPVTIRAKAWNDRPIVSGDAYTATLQRPDMTIVNLAFNPSDAAQPATAEVGPSLFTGDGLYIATITCSVANGAKLAKSDAPLPDLNGEPAAQRTSQAFTRQVHAYFQVRGSGIIPVPGYDGDNQDQSILTANGLPPGFSPVEPFLGDADRDGIRNEDEPDIWVDTDNDKNPDVNDSDSNGNEIPDGIDPGIPYSPAANGTGSHCTLCNAATCCTSIGNCVGALPTVAVYAEGSLSLRDRAKVTTAGSGMATIVNAGTELTELGVKAQAGNVRAGGTIHLNAEASITGYAVTASDITLDAGANPPASSFPYAAVSFQPLSSFAVTIPSSGILAEVGGGQAQPIAPGTYGELRIQPGGTAYLSSGTYYLQKLDVEPQAILALDMAAGPIYLYLADSVIYRGSLITTAGESSDFFIGYLGTQTTALEYPFTGTFVAPKSTLLIGPPGGGDVFAGSFYAADIEVRPDVEIVGVPFGHVWLSSTSTGGGSGGGGSGGGTGSGSFTCLEACLSATSISRYQFSGNFNTTAEVWFVTSDVPNGWQASNTQGREIRVNGVFVTPGQMPLPEPVGGKYYIQFTSGGVTWANWSFW